LYVNLKQLQEHNQRTQNLSEDQLQARAWAIYRWMNRNKDITWCQQVGHNWLGKLWRLVQ
jgi:hypothetical protein